jgi:hypothetical protein
MTPLAYAVFALIAITALTTLGYAVWVHFVPFKTCRRCRGYSRVPTRSGRGKPKLCRRCNGTGLRPRLFARPRRAAIQVLRDARGPVRR